MRSLTLRSLALTAMLASLSWIVVSGCGEEYRTDHRPIEVRQLEFPDSVQVGRPDSLVAFAVVGYSGCTPGEIRLDRSGDSLVVSGTFSCRYRVDARPGGIGITSAPAAPLEGRAVLALPSLEAGTYRVVGEVWPGRWLADTLVVTTAPPLTRDWRIAGYGSLAPHSTPACATTPVAYLPSLYGEFWKQYLVLDPPAPLEPGPFSVTATLLGPASCDPSFAGVLRLRSAVPQ